MPRYLIQRTITIEMEVEAKDGKEAVRIARDIPQDDPRWLGTLDSDVYWSSVDDDEDEGVSS